MQRIYGNPLSEVVGRPLWNDQTPEEKAALKARLRRVLAGEVVTEESPWARRDGRVVHTSVTAFPVKDRRGLVVGVSAIARDVTDQKRAQEERDRLHRALQRRFQTLLPALVWGAAVAAWLVLSTLIVAVLLPGDFHDHFLLAGVLAACLVGMALGVGVYAQRAHTFRRDAPPGARNAP